MSPGTCTTPAVRSTRPPARQRGIAAKRFAPNPFGDGHLYRTGERARWTADGRLEPITAGEPRLQAALEAIDGVAAAATRHWESRGTTTLAGYVAVEPENVDTEAFLDSVRSALPAEFAGAALIVVEDLEPATLTRPRVTATGPSEPPATPTEETLAAMLVDLLGVPAVGRYDDFFTLGGDSILAVQLAARARDTGVALTARMVFEHPGLADLAAAIDAAGDATGRGRRRAP